MGVFFFFPLPFSLFFFLLFFFYSTFRPFYFIVLLHFLLFFFVPVLTSLLVIYTGRKCLYTLPFLYFPSMHYVFSAGQLVDGNFLNSYVSLFLFHFFIFFLLRPSRRHLALLYFPYLFYFMSSLYGISAFLFFVFTREVSARLCSPFFSFDRRQRRRRIIPIECETTSWLST